MAEGVAAPSHLPDGTTRTELGRADTFISEDDNLYGEDANNGSVSPAAEVKPNRRNGEEHMEIKQDPDSSGPATMPTKTVPRKQTSTSSRPKIEGLESDKRYLCHVCNKLFTRRRSVKDHINKIHPGHTFDPEKSIEVIVDPATGIPVDPTVIPELPPGVSPPPPIPAPAASRNDSKTLKTEASVTGSRASSVDPFSTPAPVIGQKRPAPSSSTTVSATVMKKGTATKVKHTTTPATKKIKTNDSESITETPVFRSPSGTPASSRVSKTTAPRLKKQSSASVTSSPAPSESKLSVDAPEAHDDVDTPNTNDDGEVFCICRKGDNHTWMIACDGQCEDWYHGKCVGIEERDGDLIDKYICPSCTREGFQTTWKRMCRRKACRKPARVTDDPPSKYCSQACGKLFFAEMVQRSDPDAVPSPTGQHIVEPVKQKKYRKKKRRHIARVIEDRDYTDLDQKQEESPYPSPPGAVATMSSLKRSYSLPHEVTSDEEASKVEYETDSSSDQEPLPSRGGALRAGEIRALAAKYSSIERWREMGERPTDAPVDHNGDPKLVLSEFEQSQIAFIGTEIADLRRQVLDLTARETFLGLVKKRSAAVIEKARKENPKHKEICGFDPRLSWPDEDFLEWRNSPEGISAFDTETLEAPNDCVKEEEKSSGEDDENVSRSSTKDGVCIKNRCQRHGKWQKVHMAEIRFEMDRLTRSIDMLERQQMGIKDRAVLRAWENDVA
jgi:COMPASS component SPP1